MIKLVKPYIKFRDVKNDFKTIFKSGNFTKGIFVEEFRKKLLDFTGAKFCHLTTSATTALSISLKALGIKEGDEVLISDFSFPATANVVEDLGAIPVFVDVSLDSFNMLPDDLEKKIGPNSKAVIFVDAFGNPSGINKIAKICKENNIPLIEDAACAVGSSTYNKKVGNIADITCFSFHPRKVITTGEGGAITFNSAKLNTFFSVKLNHGAIFEDGKFDFIDFGYNYRLPDLQAVMGSKQLNKIDIIIKSRKLIRDKYIKDLLPLGFKPQFIDNESISNFQSIVFLVPNGILRDDLIKKLREKKIESTIGTYCLSGLSYYKGKYNSVQKNASFLGMNTITLPCFDGVNVRSITSQITKIMLSLGVT